MEMSQIRALYRSLTGQIEGNLAECYGCGVLMHTGNISERVNLGLHREQYQYQMRSGWPPWISERNPAWPKQFACSIFDPACKSSWTSRTQGVTIKIINQSIKSNQIKSIYIYNQIIEIKSNQIKSINQLELVFHPSIHPQPLSCSHIQPETTAPCPRAAARAKGVSPRSVTASKRCRSSRDQWLSDGQWFNEIWVEAWCGMRHAARANHSNHRNHRSIDIHHHPTAFNGSV